MADEYIKKSDVKNAMHSKYADDMRKYPEFVAWLKSAVNIVISEIPAADVVPALYGKWIERHDYIECSFCGFTVLDTYCEKRDCTNGDTYFNFCPRCGAYMGEPETTKG